MKKKKSALVISDNLLVILEMERLLPELEVEHVFKAQDSETGLKKAKNLQPDFTFVDMDLKTDSANIIVTQLELSEETQIVLLKKKFRAKNICHEDSKFSELEKPITLNRLNDIVRPEMSYAALLQEAQSLLEYNSHY